MDYKDYYKILGVPKNASDKEVKSAYRKLARELHPDVNPDQEAIEQFKEINEAYEVLGDTDKRATYDKLGRNYHTYAQQGGHNPWDTWWSGQETASRRPNRRARVEYGAGDFDFGDGGEFSDFFNSVFGNSQRREQTRRATRRRGEDLTHTLRINLAEAYHGTVRMLQNNGRQIEVKIPKGAKVGTKIRIAGQGGPGLNDIAGDLYLRIEVLDDARFERKGDDLYYDLPVDLYVALLGGQARVSTLAGDVLLTIKPETDNTKMFRLRGKGMPSLRQPDTFGDLYVRIQVELPKNITQEERELFKQLAELRNPTPDTETIEAETTD